MILIVQKTSYMETLNSIFTQYLIKHCFIFRQLIIELLRNVFFTHLKTFTKVTSPLGSCAQA